MAQRRTLARTLACSGFAAMAAPAYVFAASCADAGLNARSRLIVELREAAQPERDAEVFRSADEKYWFIPARAEEAGASSDRADASPSTPPAPSTTASTCTHDGETLRRVAAEGDAITWSAATGVMTYIDRNSPDYVLDMRRRNAAPGSQVLPALGVNYQLNASWINRGLSPSAQAEVFGYRAGWYGATTFGLAPGKTTRFESYALHEDVESAVSLRLGDSVTGATMQGESLRFGGVSWGTDTTLQPMDFAPVLPDLRGGNVVPGPMELFINDTLQFQQTLRSGVYDLRNIPAQQGFNSYRIRTTDALGNAVTVVREIYLPTTLLPPGVSTWRVDAGFRRQDFLGNSFDYGAPVASGSYARGLDYDSTAGAFGLVTRKASAFSASYDRRLGDLWTGHASVHQASTEGRQGTGWRLRVEGGSRAWRALAETMRSAQGLPSLDAGRTPLLSQQLLRLQWTGWSGFTPGFTFVRSHRAGEAPQQVSTLFATLRPFDWGATLTLNLTQLRSGTLDQKSLVAGLLIPLEPRNAKWRDNLAASANATDGGVATRVQYNSTAIDGSAQQWTAALNHDTRNSAASADASWSGQTSIFELAASGRAISNDVQAQFSARSGVVWTQGATFFTRPVGGAFAIVNTGQEGMAVLHENRRVAVTNADGIAFVPGLNPLEANHLTLDPTGWPIEWHAPQTRKDVVAPRGGGVLVSFRVNKESWPAAGLVLVLDEAGEPYAPGTEVEARVDKQAQVGVINRKGQVWLGELLPATRFIVRRGETECEYEIPVLDAATEAAPLRPQRCVPGKQLKS